MERKKGTQLSSADANEGSAYFQPAACLGKKISVSDIDGLKIFKLYKHLEIRPQIEVMKTNCATLPAFAYVLLAVLTTVTHPPLARLSVSLASEASMQLTMTIRRSLTPTTFSYPCSHSSTNEHSTSRVSRSKGEGKFREWVWGLGDC